MFPVPVTGVHNHPAAQGQCLVGGWGVLIPYFTSPLKSSPLSPRYAWSPRLSHHLRLLHSNETTLSLIRIPIRTYFNGIHFIFKVLRWQRVPWFSKQNPYSVRWLKGPAWSSPFLPLCLFSDHTAFAHPAPPTLGSCMCFENVPFFFLALGLSSACFTSIYNDQSLVIWRLALPILQALAQVPSPSRGLPWWPYWSDSSKNFLMPPCFYLS